VLQLKEFVSESEEIPWQTLNYTVAKCNYGGRVTDDQDRRLIQTHLEDFYNTGILEDSYNFSESGRKLSYYAPEETDMQGYIDFISENLPRTDVPEIFGLHDNA
jgi:dynein heavy chain